MKMDLAGAGGTRAHGVAACQSQPSDIWEQLNARGERDLRCTVQLHYHAISKSIAASLWDKCQSVQLSLLFRLNGYGELFILFHWFATQLAMTELTVLVDW